MNALLYVKGEVYKFLLVYLLCSDFAVSQVFNKLIAIYTNSECDVLLNHLMCSPSIHVTLPLSNRVIGGRSNLVGED